MIELQEIITAFNTLINGQSTQVIKSTESRLKELYIHPAFFKVISLILLEEQIAIPIRKMAAVNLHQFVKQNKRNNTIPPQNLIKDILIMLCDPRFDYSLTSLLMVPLEDLLSDDANFDIRKDLMNNLIESLFNNSINYKQAVLLGQGLLGKKANSKDIKSLVNLTLTHYCSLAVQLNMQVPVIVDQRELIKLLQTIAQYSKIIRGLIARIGLLDVETSNLLFLPQLEEVVRTAFQLTVPGNTLNSHLYFLMVDEDLSFILNSIKRNYISVLSTFLRTIVSCFKDKAKIATSPLYLRSGQIVEYCIKATADLLQNKQYYQLSTKSLILSCLFEAMGLTITALRNNDFYQVIRINRTQLIEKVLLPCLVFSPLDIDQFYQNQAEFVQKVLQIVDHEIGKKKKKGEQQEIQIYDTLKTYSGECLKILCKYQDQVLAEIFGFTMNILEGKLGCPLPRSVFILLLTLLKPRINHRTQFQVQIGQFLVKVLRQTEPPIINLQQRKEADIEYALVLLAVSKYSPDLTQICSDLLQATFQRGISILQQQSESEVYKNLVFELFDEVNRLENGQQYALDLVNLYNSLLVKAPTLRLLDSYSQLIQYNLQFFKGHLDKIFTGIFIISKEIERQLERGTPELLFLNKGMNVIREIGESKFYLPQVIPQLQKAILPLLPYFDGRQGDLQEDILLLLAAFLESGKSVTLGQQQMFEIIPKVFFNQYHCIFGQAFTTVHSFIYYGANVLANAPQAIQAILNMSFASMSLLEHSGHSHSQVDNCEGVMVLQSLALSCGSFITKENWMVIIGQAINRLNNQIKDKRLIANIFALLCLGLVHTQHFLSQEENSVLLARILAGANNCVKVRWADKVLIVALSELMINLERNFIIKNFNLILEFILVLLASTLTPHSSLEAAILQQSLNDEELDYQTLIDLIRNNIKELDEFTFFRLQLNKLLTNYKQTTLEVIQKLPQQHQDFLGRLMTTQKVESQPRTILKIKKN